MAKGKQKQSRIKVVGPTYICEDECSKDYDESVRSSLEEEVTAWLDVAGKVEVISMQFLFAPYKNGQRTGVRCFGFVHYKK